MLIHYLVDINKKTQQTIRDEQSLIWMRMKMRFRATAAHQTTTGNKRCFSHSSLSLESRFNQTKALAHSLGKAVVVVLLTADLFLFTEQSRPLVHLFARHSPSTASHAMPLPCIKPRPCISSYSRCLSARRSYVILHLQGVHAGVTPTTSAFTLRLYLPFLPPTLT